MDTSFPTLPEMPLKEAEARLSDLVEAASQGAPSMITRDGKPAAVVLGYEEWQRLSGKPSFVDLLLACPIREGDAHLFERDQSPPRDFEF